MRRLRLLAAISTGLALAAGAVLPLPASAEAPRGTAAAPPAPGGAATVRLITGDRVALTRGPDGRQDGTHVASVVGGSGVGSGFGSTHRGVAPGARLLVGKVLGDDGSGSSSQVIAGM
ncbi:hypothetical protein [Streptomyces rubiginosohelvolus]|uniref:hypothetical protein n=1 Tax=Streptomyces rubiginosohelvolus TaxID=67362 RepID=UPI0037AAAFA3